MAQLALALIAGVMTLLLIVVRAGEQRWRALGMDLDGNEPLTHEGGAPRRSEAGFS